MTLDLINGNSNTLVMKITWAYPTATETYTMTISPGNYTITSLAAEIQTQMNAAASTSPNTGGTWDVSIDTTTLLLSIKVATYPVGVTTATIEVVPDDKNYLLSILGLTEEATPPDDPHTGINTSTALTGSHPVNIALPQNLLIYLDNKSMDFNSLRILKSEEIDDRCFANFDMPSGNGVYGGTPSVGTVNGDAILVQGTSSVSGLGSYTITKDMTNAYYKAYEGSIPSVRYINVKIRQLLPDDSVVTPDFNGANHSMEFEMKARVDKISLTTSS